MREFASRLLPGKKILTNHRPKWLRGCELDVYFPTENFALEFNGRQHYQLVPRYHASLEDLAAQQDRDQFKASVCANLGISLVIVEWRHVRSEETFREHISSALGRTPGKKPAAPKRKASRKAPPVVPEANLDEYGERVVAFVNNPQRVATNPNAKWKRQKKKRASDYG